MFVNTLALKNKIEPMNTFEEFVNLITASCLEAFKHQAYPFDKLIEKLNVPRDVSRNNPLFDTMFVFQNEGNPTLNFGDIQTNYYIPDNQTSKFDFLLEVVPQDNSLKLNLEYCNEIYSKDFMENFLKHYLAIFDFVLSNKEAKIKDISLLSNEEKNDILSTYENNVLTYPSDKSIITLFENRVENTPNSTAVWYQDQKITYRELKEKVDSFSYYLYKRGVKKGDIVGTLLDRSTNLIVSMLSIMKCGGIYLPISKNFPKDRIDYIIKNSKLKTLIVDASYKEIDLKIDIVSIDSIADNKHLSWDGVETSPTDTIYSIYT